MATTGRAQRFATLITNLLTKAADSDISKNDMTEISKISIRKNFNQ